MRTADCHPKEKHFCKGFCRNCYMREFRNKNPAYREYMRKYARLWRKKPELQAHLKRQYRNKKLRAKYGITMADYEAMIAAQGSKCAICHAGFTSSPHVDHSHETGTVRGLLCVSCNTGLGFFKDDHQTLQRAISYLSKGSEDKTAAMLRK